MYCNSESDAIIYDIDQLKRQKRQQPYDQNISAKLDRAERALKALRCQVAQQGLKEDTMYLIDPSQDDYPDGSRLGGDAGPAENAYRINPNINDNFTKAEEQYTEKWLSSVRTQLLLHGRLI